MNETKNVRISKKDDFEKYSQIKDMLLNFNYEQSLDQNNDKINQIHLNLDTLSIQSKNEAYSLIKNSFLNILEDDNSEKILKSLYCENRKFFERIVICENLEEYILLNHVINNKEENAILKKYEITLEKDFKNNKMVNECLLSSKSWNLTKFLRIKSLLLK